MTLSVKKGSRETAPFMRLERPALDVGVSGTMIFTILSRHLQGQRVVVNERRSMGLISRHETRDPLSMTDVLERMSIEDLADRVQSYGPVSSRSGLDLRRRNLLFLPHPLNPDKQKLVLQLRDAKNTSPTERNRYEVGFQRETGMAIATNPKNPFDTDIALAVVDGPVSEETDKAIIEEVLPLMPKILAFGKVIPDIPRQPHGLPTHE